MSADMKCVIGFPCTDAAGILGQKCLASLCNVDMFMPTRTDEILGISFFHDLHILCEDGTEVKRTANPDFSDPNIRVVFFPCIGEF